MTQTHLRLTNESLTNKNVELEREKQRIAWDLMVATEHAQLLEANNKSNDNQAAGGKSKVSLAMLRGQLLESAKRDCEKSSHEAASCKVGGVAGDMAI